MEILAQAMAEVQEALAPRIQTRASALFRRMTGGRYDGIAVTAGAELLAAEPQMNGKTVPRRILSAGTADQMYLALRLALAEALQGPEPIPLVLDDPFLTFDRPRLNRAMDLLLELSAENQVILVTKDEVLRDWALAAGARVESLGIQA